MFSVVIPLYNKELSIQNTILSVLEQSYQNFEIVIINDGSTDGSVDAVKTINDERIRLIHQQNQGVSAARNLGIKEARYEWIAFLDGDDLWGINHLEEIVNMMALFPYEKVYVTSFEYSDKRPVFKHARSSEIFKIEKYFKEAKKEKLIWTSIIVIEKSCFSLVGLFNTSLNNGEDIELWCRLAEKFNIIKSTKITAVYRIEAENRSKLGSSIEKTHVYNLSLTKTNDKYQYQYYKKMILDRLYDYLRAYRLKDFMLVRGKFELIKSNEIIIYITKKIISNIFYKIRK